MRVAVNERSAALNALVSTAFKWEEPDQIEWLSPLASDDYAEYFDGAFIERLGISQGDLQVPLTEFWPQGGPRWDGLARTISGKYILVEAKAYIEEGVDYSSRATPKSLAKIHEALDLAKAAFGASDAAPWQTPFYQYANRLAHLYFLRQLNGLDANLLFLNFADAPDVPEPCSTAQWEGATRLIERCLGLGAHQFRNHVRTVVWSVPTLLADGHQS